jgi:hypothetical protein
MDLRRRTTQSLAAAGALLIVTGLSLGGGVAVAVPIEPTASSPEAGPAASPSADSSSDKSSKKDRKSKKSTTTTSADSADSPADSTDSSGGSGRSTGSTASTATTTPAPTGSTATTATTAPTRPTATSATTATTTTTATTAASSSNAPAEATPDGSGGTYDGKPIAAAEDDSTTTTIDDGRDSETPPAARKPAARSGSEVPPGIYPADPGTPAARTANSPAPAATPAPAAPVLPNPPIVVTETQPVQTTSSTGVAAGAADSGTETSPAAEVRSADQVESERPSPPRQSRQLGQTGDGTRRLIIFGGVALLLGAVVVGFTARDGGPALLAAASMPAGPVRRRSRPRRELDGWEGGIPLSPTKRELARARLGISAGNYSDDELGV